MDKLLQAVQQWEAEGGETQVGPVAPPSEPAPVAAAAAAAAAAAITEQQALPTWTAELNPKQTRPQ
jgi:hypothetical protein